MNRLSKCVAVKMCCCELISTEDDKRTKHMGPVVRQLAVLAPVFGAHTALLAKYSFRYVNSYRSHLIDGLTRPSLSTLLSSSYFCCYHR